MMRIGTMTACAVALGVGCAAHAQTVYSTGFETPNFNLGSANGQDGWLNGSNTGQGQSVSGNFARTGEQSLEWDLTGTFQSFASVRRAMAGQNGGISASTPLEISVWMFVTGNSGANRLFGIYAMNGSTSTLGGTNLGLTIGGDGVVRTGTTWGSTYQGGGLFQSSALLDNWVQVRLTYDGVGGSAAILDSGMNELFSTSFGSVLLANANGGGEWGVNLGTDWFATTDREGLAYMDDLMIRVIPAPTGVLALGAGLALVGGRRRH